MSGVRWLAAAALLAVALPQGSEADPAREMVARVAARAIAGVAGRHQAER